MRAASSIVADIHAFQPEGGNWRPLDDLLDQLWATGEAGRYVPDLLSVLERFPEEDGVGVLWSVVHGVESLPGYEPALIRSVRHVPSELGITMVVRLISAGVAEVGNARLSDLLRDLAGRSDISEQIREVARDCAKYHGGRG